MSSTILVTGAAGWLGSLLVDALQKEAKSQDIGLILADIVEPKAPENIQTVIIKADLTDRRQVNALFNTPLGVPDTIYCLHGIMSRGSEDNLELGLKVNVDSVRFLLDVASTHSSRLIKFIFASSLAVYGGPLPAIITPSTIAVPQGAYGMAKLTSELFINEFTRRGLVDGRILRLPAVVIRHANTQSSAFISEIIREPLKGFEAVCPIGNSLNSPELNLPLWLASHQTTIKNLLMAKHIPAAAFVPHTRTVCLPGFTATVKDALNALENVAGGRALTLIKFKDDPVNRRIVSSWPARFDNSYAFSLGFVADEGGMEPIVRQFQKDLA